jgi:hypothetical protein
LFKGKFQAFLMFWKFPSRLQLWLAVRLLLR